MSNADAPRERVEAPSELALVSCSEGSFVVDLAIFSAGELAGVAAFVRVCSEIRESLPPHSFAPSVTVLGKDVLNERATSSWAYAAELWHRQNGICPQCEGTTRDITDAARPCWSCDGTGTAG